MISFQKNLKKYIIFYIIAVILLLLQQVLLAESPLILNIMIDGAVLGKACNSGHTLTILSWFVNIEKGFSSILILTLIILIFYIFAFLFAYLSDLLTSIATENIVDYLRCSLHKSIQRFTYEHYTTNTESGDLLQRCTTNVDIIKNTLSHFFIKGMGIIFSICYIFTIMLSQNVKMTLFSSCTVPIIFISSLIFFVYIKKQNELLYKKEAYMTEVVRENLAGVRVVKAFSMQNYEMEKFNKASLGYRNATLKIKTVEAFFWGWCDAITFAQIMFVSLYGSYLAFLGEMTVGQVVAFSQYVVMLVYPVRHLGRIVSNVGRLSVSIKRIREVLHAPKEDYEKKNDERLPVEKVTLSHVCFAYPSSTQNVLDDVSFEIKKGQILGIMGMTGSGKTTLMYLLERLYPCKEGIIKIDDIDISHIPLGNLRECIGIVLQEPFLYSKTIKENIRISCQWATDDEVIEASKKASLHKDIINMDKGYDTVVGENGITLSGGQKQRLAIARTLLKNTPIIIFDDSLSSVDTATDAEIRWSISQMRENKILIIISHRASSVSEADKIIVLDKGRISQEGTSLDLLLQEGAYKRIYELQNSI